MSTQSPTLFPTDGLRKLSPAEQMRRFQAHACTLPKDNRPSCSGQVFVGIFFDGTGNNIEEDYVKPAPKDRKHSNIVKLYQTFPFNKPGHFRHYIPGVGTAFPKIGDRGEGIWKKLGSGGALVGEQRIIWAFTRLINAPHEYVLDAQLISDEFAKTMCGNVASAGEPAFMRRTVLRTWQKKLQAALAGKKPRVEQINLSVFGFSRGAAEARAFANWLFEVCEQADGGWTFAGIPIRLQFLGIFDTVASVGLANLFDNGLVTGHASWADGNLAIHPAVEQCVHYVAGHEIRACFPLDSVRLNSHYPANAKEVMYPGAHSDLGGGYAPNDLGVSPAQDSFLSIIPGVNMYHEAHKAGVPLTTFKRLDEATQKYLTPSREVINDFNAYLKAAKIGHGPVEEMGRRHMALYFSHRFKHLHRQAFYAMPPYGRASKIDRSYLEKTQRTLFSTLWTLKQVAIEQYPQFARNWAFLHKYGGVIDNAARSWDELSAAPSIWRRVWNMSAPAMIAKFLTNDAGPLISSLKKTPLQHAFDVAQNIHLEAVTPEIETFFNRYIHDSEAGFIESLDEFNLNGIGFVKFRSVFKGDQ